jgi:hypothetical protein
VCSAAAAVKSADLGDFQGGAVAIARAAAAAIAAPAPEIATFMAEKRIMRRC